MSTRILRRAALGAAAATLLLGAPAAAHPLFEPDEVPVDSLATVTLDVAHGCEAADHAEEDDVDGEPTREVAVEVPEPVTYLEPAEADGWELELETDADGWVEVIVWTAEEGTDEPAPTFELDVVLRGEVDDEVHWRVVQACDDTTHRWVGTPEDPADEPAVTMTLVEADPDAPPPPEEQPAAEGEPAAPTDDLEEEELVEAVPEETDDELEDPEPGIAEADEEIAPGMPGWILIVVLVVTLVVAGVLLTRGRVDEPEDTDATPEG